MYKISEFAKMTGLPQSKIRFYEKNGLLKVHKDENGYRYFTPKDAFRVNAFRVLLRYGFTIEKSIEMLDDDQSEEWFIDLLKKQKTEIEKEIELNNCRLKNLNYAIHLLTNGYENLFDIVTMNDFLYVKASNGLDFSISNENEKTISKFAEILSITFYARIIKKDDLIQKNKLVHPSYVCAIPANKEEYLDDYDKTQVNYLNLGKCIRYCRKNTREESEKIESFNKLFQFIKENNLTIRGDIILLPTFLNLSGNGADIETLYISIK